MGKDFELFVFHRDAMSDMDCTKAGCRGVVVDLEVKGKHERQASYNTQINQHSLEDIISLKARGIGVICRINAIDSGSADEIDRVIDAGADELLVPMVRTRQEIEQVFRQVDGRLAIGLMIETTEALDLAPVVNDHDVRRVFVGLNDLHITQGKPTLFHVLADGTVDTIRQQIQHAAFGFGGLTLPGSGHPLPVDYFFHELARLDCQFTFLRRSFFSDSQQIPASEAIPAIQQEVHKIRQRQSSQIESDRLADQQQLFRLLNTLT
jgi:hypothetical protein